MDTRRLKSYLKIVDTGSMTRAAAALNIAQPALSQQIVSLEAHFKQKLLIRSLQGVTPTEAGLVLYRHANTILKQLEQAEIDVRNATTALTGSVSVALAPYSAGSTLSLALLKATREKHPNILLHINEGFSAPFSELIMTGRLDMALMHGAGPMRGISFEQLWSEEFFLVAPVGMAFSDRIDKAVPLSDILNLPILLPSRVNFVRKAVDAAFAEIRQMPRLAGEIESLSTLRNAVSDGAGLTILPWSVARQAVVAGRSTMHRIVAPKIAEALSLCVSDQFPLSEAAVAVRSILFDIAMQAISSGQWTPPDLDT